MSSTSIYPSSKVMPYVYICKHKENGKFYIGYRKANKTPSHLDLPKYKTSKQMVHESFSEFDWHIIAEFFDSDSAYDFENQLIYEHWNDPLLLNSHCAINYKIRFKRPEERLPAHNKGKPGTGKNAKGAPKTGAHAKGYKHTEEWKLSQSIATKGKKPNNFGIPRSQEAKDKQSISTKGIPKTGVHAKGCKKIRKITKCPHCDKSGNQSLMTRYHFNNCKNIKI